MGAFRKISYGLLLSLMKVMDNLSKLYWELHYTMNDHYIVESFHSSCFGLYSYDKITAFCLGLCTQFQKGRELELFLVIRNLQLLFCLLYFYLFLWNILKFLSKELNHPIMQFSLLYQNFLLNKHLINYSFFIVKAQIHKILILMLAYLE